MEFKIWDLRFECPHCGYVNIYNSYQMNSLNKDEIVYCGNEEGGCETKIVLSVRSQITTNAVGLKIDGFEPLSE